MVLIATAQLAVPLPFSPVPITLQTFGVMLVALVWGFRLGTSAYLATFALAAAGLGVFANGASGNALWGPTAGYLGGMLVALAGLGFWAERNAALGVPRAIAACFVASLVVIALGLMGLAFYVPRAALLEVGLWPFLPGNVIKCVAAGALAPPLNRTLVRLSAPQRQV
jgi:biotin transport system substrate-specific component